MLANAKGQCPHCRTGVRFERIRFVTGGNSLGEFDTIQAQTPGGWSLDLGVAGCPLCGRPVVSATALRNDATREAYSRPGLIWPRAGERPVPSEVEKEAPDVAADFRESVAVLPASKKASAALSRRCLQQVLMHKAGARKRDLADQIDEVIPTLPSYLAENIDAIRQVGNFAAHPLKLTSSGEIASVEDGEAEWLLEVLEELFDHFYVAPSRAETRRQALNQKLADLGKAPLKSG